MAVCCFENALQRGGSGSDLAGPKLARAKSRMRELRTMVPQNVILRIPHKPNDGLADVFTRGRGHRGSLPPLSCRRVFASPSLDKTSPSHVPPRVVERPLRPACARVCYVSNARKAEGDGVAMDPCA